MTQRKVKYLPHIDEVQKLANQIRAEADPTRLEAQLRKMLSLYDTLNYAIPASKTPMSRARITEGRALYKTSDLYYPPKRYAKAGRLNDDGSPVLYLSFQPRTALAEVHTAKGQHVQLSGFEVREGRPIQVAVVGEFYNLDKGGYTLLPTDARNRVARALQNKKQEPLRSMIYMDAFLAEILQDPIARDEGYLRSRIVARLLREKLPNVDGFHYPSVVRHGSPNLANFPHAADTKLKLSATAHGLVEEVYEYGLYRIRLNKRGHIFPPGAGMVLLREIDELL